MMAGSLLLITLNRPLGQQSFKDNKQLSENAPSYRFIMPSQGTVAWHFLFFIPKYAPNQCAYLGSIFVFSSLVSKFGSNPKFPQYWSLKLGHEFTFTLGLNFNMACFVCQLEDHRPAETCLKHPYPNCYLMVSSPKETIKNISYFFY